MKLIVAEKPSAGKIIQSIVDSKEYIVTWCYGHLVESAPPDAYGERYAERPWKLDALPCIPDTWQYSIKPSTAAQYKTVAALMNRADITEIICATDAGREGELIFRNVYNMARCKKPIKRLWISSMENAAVAEGFQKLRDGREYDNLYAAAYCRDRADWLVGMNATRLFSCVNHSFVSVGRVVSPTLAMIVRRHQDIAGFQKESFYVPELEIEGVVLSGEKYPSQADAQAVANAGQNNPAIVQSVVHKEKSEQPPKLYDLTTLQRDANKTHGYTAAQTLEIMQTLYEQQLATYPRTDSRYITADMQGSVAALVQAIDPSAPCDTAQIANDSKVSDHHAILPTRKGVAEGGSSPEQNHILDMLKTRLIDAVGERHVYAETEIAAICGGHEFRFKGKSLVSSGWKKHSDYKPVPDWSQGQELSGTTRVREGFTSPPKPYTEDTLLAAMEHAGAEDAPEEAERRGIGTPATRAAIIEKLCAAGKNGTAFVERVKKTLIPTEKGIAVIGMLPEALKSPLMTAEWEHKLVRIQKGELDADEFLREIESFTRKLVEENRNASSAMPPSRKREPLGVCPTCGQGVFEATGDKPRFYCSSKECRFIIWASIAGKRITAAQAKQLLEKGKTGLIKGFMSKAGKSFDAHLVLDPAGAVKFEFPVRKESGT